MRCPICKKIVQEPAQPEERSSLPFCSERCKLIDLGRWLDGKYQIPVSEEQGPDAGDGMADPDNDA
jgi:endogenous inhibitor of DNA gyrase (YacG/DUF329 family)